MSQWHILQLDGVPILDQLRLEEALLRADTRNWILVNHGVPPAIVMGISGKVDQLLNTDLVDVPVIRRFSGGGTVVVDESTAFVSFIGNNEALPVSPFPAKIMQWSQSLYEPIFTEQPIALRDNDYVLGERKCGGNAQSLVRGRWLHHTTWLWDYDPVRMAMLQLPSRQPEYRAGRLHDEFLCRLKPHFTSCGEFLSQVLSACSKQMSTVHDVSFEEALVVTQREYRKATCVVDVYEKNPPKGA